MTRSRLLKSRKGNDSAESFAQVERALKSRRYRAALTKVLTKNGQLKAEFHTDKNHAWYLVGDARYRLGDFNKALIAFNKSVADWDGDYQAHWAIGDCYIAMGDLKSAVGPLQQAYEISGSNEVAYDLANILFDLKLYRNAILIYSSIAGAASRDLKRKIDKNAALAAAKLEHRLNRRVAIKE